MRSREHPKILEWSDEVAANARLIAAAPDLLAALDKARFYIARDVEDEDEDGPGLKLLREIDAAIAKAEGTS